MSALYRPPAPHAIGETAALFRAVLTGDRDLLRLIPKSAYRQTVATLGFSRRKIVLVNAPAAVRRVLNDEVDAFPKSDLMVDSLEPLIHDGLFISHGAVWRRQRAMLDPAFTQLRLSRAFPAMAAAVDASEARLDAAAAAGNPVSLEREMSQLTADIIYRTIFSRSLEDSMARDFFDAWATFQETVATLDLKRLILARAWAPVRQPADTPEAARVIRGHLGRLIDERRDPNARAQEDIVGDVIAARDPETGEAFDRESLIDQIGVFFLAGHETTASALTWAFYILASQPDWAARLRTEIDRELGEREIGFGDIRALSETRSVFRESLRLYPPLGFVPRVSAKDTEIEGVRVPRGALIMIAPWIIHRNETLWRDADRFDPERFSPAREKEQVPGAYLPFGFGPRVCIGAAFAQLEGVLILARLIRRYDLSPADPAPPRPVSHLATRPASEIHLHVSRHGRRAA
jgi:cytochrome P450